MTWRTLRIQRRPVLILGGLGSITAGAWTAAAELLGAVLGAGVGLVVLGVVLLVVDGLST